MIGVSLSCTEPTPTNANGPPEGGPLHWCKKGNPGLPVPKPPKSVVSTMQVACQFSGYLPFSPKVAFTISLMPPTAPIIWLASSGIITTLLLPALATLPSASMYFCATK